MGWGVDVDVNSVVKYATEDHRSVTDSHDSRVVDSYKRQSYSSCNHRIVENSHNRKIFLDDNRLVVTGNTLVDRSNSNNGGNIYGNVTINIGNNRQDEPKPVTVKETNQLNNKELLESLLVCLVFIVVVIALIKLVAIVFEHIFSVSIICCVLLYVYNRHVLAGEGSTGHSN